MSPVSDGVSPLPKGNAEPARPPLSKSATDRKERQSAVFQNVWEKATRVRSLRSADQLAALWVASCPETLPKISARQDSLFSH